MSDRIWRFCGKLQENEKRVLTDAEGWISEIKVDESPSLDVITKEGKLIIDLKLPPFQNNENQIGQQYLVNGNNKNALGQPYGEIFNDYTNNIAQGIYSHVSGYNNTSLYSYQTVIGKYNKNNTNNVFEIGYGDNNSNRKNIFSVGKDGTAVAAGDIKNGNGVSLDSLKEEKIDIKGFYKLMSESLPQIHRYTNDTAIEVNNIETPIVSIPFISTTATVPLFWGTVPFTNTEDTVVEIKYYINNVLQEDDTLYQTFNAGTHYLSLFNTFEIQENFSGTYKVTITALNGTLNIADYSIKSALYVQGVGITAEWNGNITLKDNFTPFNISDKGINTILPIQENIEVKTQNPVVNGMQQIFNKINFKKINIIGFTDNIETSRIITNYVFNTLSAKQYEYNNEYITTANKIFALKTKYNFTSKVESIDNGKLIAVQIKTTDKKNIESVVVNFEY